MLNKLRLLGVIWITFSCIQKKNCELWINFSLSFSGSLCIYVQITFLTEKRPHLLWEKKNIFMFSSQKFYSQLSSLHENGSIFMFLCLCTMIQHFSLPLFLQLSFTFILSLSPHFLWLCFYLFSKTSFNVSRHVFWIMPTLQKQLPFLFFLAWKKKNRRKNRRQLLIIVVKLTTLLEVVFHWTLCIASKMNSNEHFSNCAKNLLHCLSVVCCFVLFCGVCWLPILCS